MSRIVPAFWAWALGAKPITGPTAVAAKIAATVTRIACQPPDLHIPFFGIRPVCLSVRRSLTLPTRGRRAGASLHAPFHAPSHKARTTHPFLPGPDRPSYQRLTVQPSPRQWQYYDPAPPIRSVPAVGLTFIQFCQTKAPIRPSQGTSIEPCPRAASLRQ